MLLWGRAPQCGVCVGLESEASGFWFHSTGKRMRTFAHVALFPGTLLCVHMSVFSHDIRAQLCIALIHNSHAWVLDGCRLHHCFHCSAHTLTHTDTHRTHTLLLDLLHGAGGQLPLQWRWRNPILIHSNKQLPVDVESWIKHLKTKQKHTTRFSSDPKSCWILVLLKV